MDAIHNPVFERARRTVVSSFQDTMEHRIVDGIHLQL
jgi:hypothetical protein